MGTAEIVASIGRKMRDDIDAVAWRNVTVIADQVPDLHAARVEDALYVSCRANILVVMNALAAGAAPAQVEISAEALGYARMLVVAGIGLDVVRRAYRVGTYDTIQRWSEEVAAEFAADPHAVPAAAFGSQFLLTWMDRVLEQVAREFRVEDERLARERTLRRLSDVRLLLSGGTVDQAALESRLGYRLTGSHQAAVLRSARGGVDLLGVARTLYGGAPFLPVDFDESTLWCWSPTPAADVATPDVWIGVGRTRPGLDGFRLSHAEAAEALRVAELNPDGAVALIDDVAVTALCVVDPRRAQEFVAAVLGPLIAPTDAGVRQRETLRAFLECGMNSRQAGARLALHHNTVRYRVAQMEKLLGRRVADVRLELELALRLHGDLSGLRDSAVRA